MGAERERWETVDRVCDAYEAARRRGPADPLRYLDDVPEGWRPELLTELKAIDDEYAGQPDGGRDESFADAESRGGERDRPEDQTRALGGGVPIPELPDRFEVRGRVGGGGYADVFRAWDRRLSREVAIKIPRGPAFDVRDAVRFDREARAAAAVDHPGVVQVYEVLRVAGRPALVQRMVEGPTLDEHFKRHSTLHPSDAAGLVAGIADAVAAAHDRGVVHRDLSPANVVLESGRPVVLDFGLACRRSASTRLTISGTVLGTPAYMSPEQAEGDPACHRPTTDVYSIGCVLYRSLVGSPPLRGTATEILRALRDTPPVPPRRLRPGIPRDLEAVTMQCLAKQPADRYPDAGAVAADLRRFLGGLPVRARRVSAARRAAAWTRRHPVAALLAVVVPVMIGLAAAGLASSGQRRRLQHLSDDLQRSMADVQLSRASLELSRGDPRRAAAILGRTDPRRRDWLWRLLRRLSDDRSLAWHHGDEPQHGFTVSAVAVSPVGPAATTAWSVNHAGTVMRWDFAGDARVPAGREIHRAAVRLNALAVDPTGRWLAWGSNHGDVTVYDTIRDRVTGVVTIGVQCPVRAVAFADGGRLYAGGGAPPAGSPRGDGRPWLLAVDIDPAGQPRLSDRRRIAVDGELSVTAIDATDRSEILVATGRPSTDSQRGIDGSIDRWTVGPDGFGRRSVIATGPGVMDIARDRNTGRLAWCDRGGMVHVVDPDDGATPVTFNVGGEPLRSVVFGPRGRTVWSAGHDGSLHGWSLGDRRPIGKLRGHRQPVFDLALVVDPRRPSPDDAALLSCGSDGRLRLWRDLQSNLDGSITLAADEIIDVQYVERGPDAEGGSGGDDVLVVLTRKDDIGDGVAVRRIVEPGSTHTSGVSPTSAVGSAQVGPFGSLVQWLVADPRPEGLSIDGDLVSFGTRTDWECWSLGERRRLATLPLPVNSQHCGGVLCDGHLYRHVVENGDQLRPPYAPQVTTTRIDRFEWPIRPDAKPARGSTSFDPLAMAGLVRPSPDGRWLAIVDQIDTDIILIPRDPAGGRLRYADALIRRGHDRLVSDLRWFESGDEFVTASWDGSFIRWSIEGSGDDVSLRPVYRVQASNRSLTSIAVRPGGGPIATCGDDQIVRLWTADDGTEILSLDPRPGPVATVRFSPDGGTLLIALSEGVLQWLRLIDDPAGDGRTMRGL